MSKIMLSCRGIGRHLLFVALPFIFLLAPQSRVRAENVAPTGLPSPTGTGLTGHHLLGSEGTDAELAVADQYATVNSAGSYPDTRGSFENVEYPAKFFARNTHIKRYAVMVAVDRSDPSGAKYAEHKLAEIRRYADAFGIKIDVVEIPADEIDNISQTYANMALELKRIERNPNVAADLEQSAAGQRLSRLRNYWQRIHVPATRSNIIEGLMYGVALQGTIQFLTANYLKQLDLTTTLTNTAVVCIFGGVLGTWNSTFRKFLRSPDRPGPMYTKMTANSAIFAFSVGVALDPVGTFGFFGLYKILEHAGLSQIAKVYLHKLFAFREKYGYMSERSAYYTMQVGVFALYLFLRLAHIYELPMFAYGFYVMGPAGFFTYVGYKAYLAAVLKTGQRFYTVANKDEALLVLAEMERAFNEKYTRDHPILGRSDQEKLKANAFRMATRVFVYEVFEVGLSMYHLSKGIIRTSLGAGKATVRAAGRCLGVFAEPSSQRS